MNPATDQYPVITMETLQILERRVDARRATLDDYLLLEHYMDETGNAGSILKAFARHGASSFEEFLEIIKGQDRTSLEMAADLTGILLGHIHFLMTLVEDGETIH